MHGMLLLRPTGNSPIQKGCSISVWRYMAAVDFLDKEIISNGMK